MYFSGLFRRNKRRYVKSLLRIYFAKTNEPESTQSGMDYVVDYIPCSLYQPEPTHRTVYIVF